MLMALLTADVAHVVDEHQAKKFRLNRFQRQSVSPYLGFFEARSASACIIPEL
jgi:hypothetical protein